MSSRSLNTSRRALCQIILANYLKIMHSKALVLVVIICSVTLVISGRPKRKSKESGCYENLCKKGKEKYPMDKIKKLLSKYQQNDIKMDETTVIEPTKKEHSKPKLTMRMYSFSSEENLCLTKRYTIFPRFDKERNLTIINVPRYYEQKLVFETCVDGSGRCRKSSFILDYETSCKQLYNNVRLLYVDSNDNLKYTLSRVPNACVCVYKKNKSFSPKEI